MVWFVFRFYSVWFGLKNTKSNMVWFHFFIKLNQIVPSCTPSFSSIFYVGTQKQLSDETIHFLASFLTKTLPETLPPRLMLVHLVREKPKTLWRRILDIISIWDYFLFLVTSWAKVDPSFSRISFVSLTCNLGLHLLP